MTDNTRPAEEHHDPIVAEVRAHRRQLVKEHGGIKGLAEFLREQDAKRRQREQDAASQREKMP